MKSFTINIRSVTAAVLIGAAAVGLAGGIANAADTQGVLYGDPDTASSYWVQQSLDDCSLMATADVVGQLTGNQPSEQEIVDLAGATPSAHHDGPVYLPAPADNPDGATAPTRGICRSCCRTTAFTPCTPTTTSQPRSESRPVLRHSRMRSSRRPQGHRRSQRRDHLGRRRRPHECRSRSGGHRHRHRSRHRAPQRQRHRGRRRRAGPDRRLRGRVEDQRPRHGHHPGDRLTDVGEAAARTRRAAASACVWASSPLQMGRKAGSTRKTPVW